MSLKVIGLAWGGVGSVPESYDSASFLEMQCKRVRVNDYSYLQEGVPCLD